MTFDFGFYSFSKERLNEPSKLLSNSVKTILLFELEISIASQSIFSQIVKRSSPSKIQVPDISSLLLNIKPPGPT